MAATKHHDKYRNPELREVWDYNPETGKFTWKIRFIGGGRRINPGDEAGGICGGYVQLTYDGISYRAHRLAWYWQTGELPPKGYEIDHENRIRSDNRWTNLRLLPSGHNNLNKSIGSNNSTGVIGVYKQTHSDTWFARIYVDKKRIHLGNYPTFEEAVQARKAAEDKFWGNESIEPIIVQGTPESRLRKSVAAKSWHARKRSNPKE